MARQYAKVTVQSKQLRAPRLTLKAPKLAAGRVSNGKRKA